MARRLVIGICGGTGSGKTTITDHIIGALSEEGVLVLQQDHATTNSVLMMPRRRSAQQADPPRPLLLEVVLVTARVYSGA